MPNCTICSVSTVDARFALPPGAGTDSVHTNSEYCMAVTRLAADSSLYGTGIALTLGEGNRLVCDAIEMLAKPLVGLEINELMSDFGNMSRRLADDPSLRWLGPHKGVVHLALASITNACFDLWAKSREVPLWKLLLDLTPEELVRTLDLSYLEGVLSEDDALGLLHAKLPSRDVREPSSRMAIQVMTRRLGGWLTTTGRCSNWLHARIDQGFRALKLKVGSADESRDLRRAAMLREAIGDSGYLMFDANQRWNLPSRNRACAASSRNFALFGSKNQLIPMIFTSTPH